MSADRFFIEGVRACGDVVELRGGDARKAAVVLRKRIGDALELIDSAGRLYRASIVTIASDRVALTLDAELAAPPPATLRITLVQGVPTGAKMDFVVEKATELGVARIVPLLAERTQGAGAGSAAKLERWRRLARAAAQQCGRCDVPEVAPYTNLGEALTGPQPGERVVIAWELAARTPLRERLPALLAGLRDVRIVIGPEGGFARGEVEQAMALGAEPVSLGDRILRTETAGLVLCAAMRYACGEL